MKFFSKKNTIDIQTADAMLQDVFKSCDVTPNKVPLKTLVENCNYNGKYYVITIIISIVFLLVTLIVPIREYFSYGDAKGKISLVYHEEYDSTLRICVSSDNVDLGRCYMEDSDGNRTPAISLFTFGKTVVFPFPDREMNIYIYDFNGEELHLLFTPD